MTEDEIKLVLKVRLDLLNYNYPPIFAVTNEELCAVEKSIEEFLISINKEPILKCGDNGLWFKGCELVLKVD